MASVTKGRDAALIEHNRRCCDCGCRRIPGTVQPDTRRSTSRPSHAVPDRL